MGIEPLAKAARTLEKKQDLVLNWFRANAAISSGAVEGLNNKVKIRRKTRVCEALNACQVCTKTAETGVCKAENAACAADAECKAFESCRNGCSTQECIDQNCLSLLLEQSDFDLYNAQGYCLCNENACFDECKCQ